jgi:glycosyltransferase involved in cell wall biosynthesis
MVGSKKIIATVTNPLFHDRRMQRICSALSEAGADVVLLGVKRNNVPQLNNTNFRTVLLKTWVHSGAFFYLEYNIRLFFYLLFHSFDLVISVDLDSLLAGSFAAKLKSKEKMYDAHEYFTEVPELQGRQLVKMIWKVIARICIGEHNMTVSKTLAELFSEKYGKQFQLVRNLPELHAPVIQNSREIPKMGPVNILYIGYLNEGRGLEYAIRMMKDLPDRVHLYLVGNGDIESVLQKIAMDLKVTDQVHFEGWKSPSELKIYLNQAHLGLNLLESRSESYYYSLANKTFDYMHYGIPGIHMDFPEYKIINAQYDCFFLLPSMEKEYLVSVVRDLLSASGVYRKKSSKNLEASQYFHWEMEKTKLLQHVNKIFDHK